ncbi:MAG: ShlB/FhaC/HecB family hemolysin secretion/activation protein [Sulfurospirillaceae bacterium]|jgi:hemolysin activation/secretion protein|nr:ShlB/FhaC/HecB family hemolysin secretion/activation protein [Sulfurospirillaceae bacterium]MDD2826594.1 ShlB/FhaC/HecB family hemolysin secretion/activation protein [Sulfurospirillaceae bacterium]
MKTTHILALSLITANALLAAPPSSSDMQRQVQVPKEVQEKSNTTIPSLPHEAYKEPMVEEHGKMIEVTHFKLTGALHIKPETLMELLKPYEGKSHSFAQLQKIASLITKAYREEGYFVARAYLPKQELKEGVLEIAIIEGNYGQFKLTNNSLVSNETIQGILDGAKEDTIISTNSLERAMLLINDTPGAKVTGADIMPGSKVGVSDFAITTEATNPYSGYILGDNYGSQYTGRYRINIGLNANSPLGYGDKLSLNGVMSTTTDLKNGKIAYGFPMMDNGLRGELSASKTTYSLANEYAALDALGNVTTLEASLIYPFIKTRLESLDMGVSYVHKNMKDEVRSTNTLSKKESDATHLTLAYMKSCLLFGLDSTTNATITLTHGNLSFKDASSLAFDQSSTKTNGDYTKLSGSIEKSIQFDPQYALTTSFRFQKALNAKNLDSSEDFSLGGAYGVRAFPNGEYSAENGYILGAELFYALPSYEGINHKASIFADTGYAKMENPLAGTQGRQLSDMGLGYQARYKEFFTKAQIARVIGGEKVESESERSTKLLLQVGWVY